MSESYQISYFLYRIKITIFSRDKSCYMHKLANSTLISKLLMICKPNWLMNGQDPYITPQCYCVLMIQTNHVYRDIFAYNDEKCSSRCHKKTIRDRIQELVMPRLNWSLALIWHKLVLFSSISFWERNYLTHISFFKIMESVFINLGKNVKSI